MLEKKKEKGNWAKCVLGSKQAGAMLMEPLQGQPVRALDVASMWIILRTCLTPLETSRSVCQGRERKKKKGFAKAGWQSRTSYLSPSSDLSMFSCLSKKDKRYDCSGMKTWVTFKQRKAETAVSGYEGNVNQPWEAFDIASLSAEVMAVFCRNK